MSLSLWADFVTYLYVYVNNCAVPLESVNNAVCLWKGHWLNSNPAVAKGDSPEEVWPVGGRSRLLRMASLSRAQLCSDQVEATVKSWAGNRGEVYCASVTAEEQSLL